MIIFEVLQVISMKLHAILFVVKPAGKQSMAGVPLNLRVVENSTKLVFKQSSYISIVIGTMLVKYTKEVLGKIVFEEFWFMIGMHSALSNSMFQFMNKL